jgi:hypothetical protein
MHFICLELENLESEVSLSGTEFQKLTININKLGAVTSGI